MLLDAISIFRREDKIDVTLMYNGRLRMNDSRALLQKMKGEENQLMKLRASGREDYKDLTTNYSIIVGVLVLFILVTSFLIILRELKERLIYQRSLEEKIIELDQTTSELEQIAYVSSHDLQEPLRKIRTFSDIFFLKFSSTIPKDGLQIIDRIHKSSIRMQGLVEDLMKITNMGMIREPFERVALNEIVKQVLVERRIELEANNIKVTIPESLPSIYGNPNNLKVLFDCLVDNAIKFSKKSDSPFILINYGEATNIEMKQKFKRKLVEKNYICVTIQDNGIGFENEYAKKIFILFQRLHQQESDYEGKGIGLTIVKRIMSNHQGFVNAEGTVNKGAKFSLYFPKVT
jgi:light-regulated signal transduction histidine kinase (bacteriophytochrome)